MVSMASAKTQLIPCVKQSSDRMHTCGRHSPNEFAEVAKVTNKYAGLLYIRRHGECL